MIHTGSCHLRRAGPGRSRKTGLSSLATAPRCLGSGAPLCFNARNSAEDCYIIPRMTMKAPFLRAGSKEHAFTHLTLRSLSLSLATDREEEKKKPQCDLTFPNCSKYCFTSSTTVLADNPPTNIFFVLVTIWKKKGRGRKSARQKTAGFRPDCSETKRQINSRKCTQRR